VTAWLFLASISDEFILGLNILRAYISSMDLGHIVLQLDDEEVPLWSSGEQPFSSPIGRETARW
jgi:hypothetical protein